MSVEANRSNFSRGATLAERWFDEIDLFFRSRWGWMLTILLLLGGLSLYFLPIHFGTYYSALTLVFLLFLLLLLKPAEGQSLTTLINRRLAFKTLNDFPNLPRIGFVGAQFTGTQTLISYAHEIPRVVAKQAEKHVASLFHLSTEVGKVFLLDSAGLVMSRRSKALEICDMVCIMLDHNEKEGELGVSETRLALQLQAIDQIKAEVVHRLKTDKPTRLKALVLIMNKADLWEQGGDENAEEIKTFLQEAKDILEPLTKPIQRASGTFHDQAIGVHIIERHSSHSVLSMNKTLNRLAAIAEESLLPTTKQTDLPS